MDVYVKIGTWHEKESREVTEHTTYAADHIEHMTIVGDYPLYLFFRGGDNHPRIESAKVNLSTNVIGGGYYSGFCGNNFAFTPEKLGASNYYDGYAYNDICELVADGRATLDPEWEFLNVNIFKREMGSDGWEHPIVIDSAWKQIHDTIRRDYPWERMGKIAVKAI
jgi:hypothetical protein